mmetsp:Transcript_56847/g.132936  ORF Transcript_56847/g.132936 Transcript_56847/m.132936 type:complete len:204 (-) Transcript_56847:537-1148(-)
MGVEDNIPQQWHSEQQEERQAQKAVHDLHCLDSIDHLGPINVRIVQNVDGDEHRSTSYCDQQVPQEQVDHVSSSQLSSLSDRRARVLVPHAPPLCQAVQHPERHPEGEKLQSLANEIQISSPGACHGLVPAAKAICLQAANELKEVEIDLQNAIRNKGESPHLHDVEQQLKLIGLIDQQPDQKEHIMRGAEERKHGNQDAQEP